MHFPPPTSPVFLWPTQPSSRAGTFLFCLSVSLSLSPCLAVSVSVSLLLSIMVCSTGTERLPCPSVPSLADAGGLVDPHSQSQVLGKCCFSPHRPPLASGTSVPGFDCFRLLRVTFHMCFRLSEPASSLCEEPQSVLRSGACSQHHAWHRLGLRDPAARCRGPGEPTVPPRKLLVAQCSLCLDSSR